MPIGKDKTRISLTIDKELLKHIDEQAKNENRTRNNWIITATLDRVNKKEATPMKETKTFETLLEAAEEMCIKTYNDGIYDNQTEKGYCVVNENGEVVTAINQRGIFQHNTDEELQNMDWQLFAEECLEIEGLDKNQEGTFSVEPI